MVNSRIILVTGGARSGKSTLAEKLASEASAHRAYIATCPCLDEEMQGRIELHQQRRLSDDWTNFEEQTELAGAVEAAAATGAGALLIDCLTLWINNLQYHAEISGTEFGESEAAGRTLELLTALRRFPGTSVLVINEVGCGIVPDNPASRAFRDASGRCGQIVAAEADAVYCCFAGIPLKIKG